MWRPFPGKPVELLEGLPQKNEFLLQLVKELVSAGSRGRMK